MRIDRTGCAGASGVGRPEDEARSGAGARRERSEAAPAGDGLAPGGLASDRAMSELTGRMRVADGLAAGPIAPRARALASAPRTSAGVRARAASARTASARTTTARAAARPADPRVIKTARRLNQVAGSIRSAKADGVITDAEEARTERLARAAEANAQGLVRVQGEPAVGAANRVLGFLKDGKLTLREADIAIDRVVAGRQALLDEADKHRRTNPFRNLGAGWRAPFHGVRTKDFTFEGRPVNVVAIDLADPRTQVQTNGPGARGRTVEDQARRRNAEVAINGDFFTFRNYKPSGPAEANGVRWGAPSGEPIFAFRGGHADIVRGGTGPEWATNMVSGRPMVLRDGAITSDYRNNGEVTRRTGVGLSKDGRMLYLVASPRLGGKQLGRLLKRVGAYEGLAMDGGGSAQMYQAGRGMVQPSSDPGGARRVANTILIQAQRR